MLDEKIIEELKVLHKKYLRYRRLDNLLTDFLICFIASTKIEDKKYEIQNEIKIIEDKLNQEVEQMRLKVISDFIATIDKDTYREVVDGWCSRIDYSFNWFERYFLYSFKRYYAIVERIFDEKVFLEILKCKQNSDNSYKKLDSFPSDMYNPHAKTFKIKANEEKYHQLISVFPKKPVDPPKGHYYYDDYYYDDEGGLFADIEGEISHKPKNPYGESGMEP